MKPFTGAALLRARYLLLVAWGLAWLPDARHRSGPLTDWGLFVYAGRALTGHAAHYTGGPLRLYVEIPGLQLGAPPLLVTRAFDAVFGLASATAATVAAALIAAAVVWMCEDVGQRITTGRPVRLVAFLAGLVVVPAMVEGVGAYGHLDDVLTLAAIVAAAVALMRRWPAWTVGALLGFAVACKPWALVVVPLLFVLPRLQWPPALLALIVMVAAWWLPFLLVAPGTLHALGSLRLPVADGSALHAMGYGVGRDAPGWVRPLQVTAGFAVAVWLVRRGWWYAAPVAGVAVRIFVDPAVWGYYGMGPVVTAALLDVSQRRRVPVWTVVAATVEYGPWPPGWAGWLRLAWAVGVVAALVIGFGAREKPPRPLSGGARRRFECAESGDRFRFVVGVGAEPAGHPVGAEKAVCPGRDTAEDDAAVVEDVRQAAHQSPIRCRGNAARSSRRRSISPV